MRAEAAPRLPGLHPTALGGTVGCALAGAAAPFVIHGPAGVELMFAASVALGLIGAVGAVRRHLRRWGSGSGWLLFAAGMACSVAGDGQRLLALVLHGPGSLDALGADWFWPVAVALISASVLSALLPQPTARARLSALLDGLLFATTSFVCAWVAVRLALPGASETEHTFVVKLAVDLGIAAGAAGATSVALVRSPGRLVGTVGLCLGAFLLDILATVIVYPVGASGRYFVGNSIDTLYLPTMTLLALAPAALPGTGPRARPEQGRLARRFSAFVPFLPPGAAALVSAAALFLRPGAFDRTAAAVSLLAVVLFAARQLLSVLEVRELAATLERRAAERAAELERSEKTLSRTQRLDAISRMAAGLAADVEAALAGLRERTTRLHDPRLGPGEADRLLAELESAALAGSGVTRRLLAFARRRPAEATCDPAALLAGMEPLLRGLAGPARKLRVTAGAAPGEVPLGAADLEEVLVQLVANARDATGPGGTIAVECAAGPADDPAAAVLLRVSDDGAGFSAEARARLFEPFFSTRPAGEAIGLGLATVQRLVGGCGGRVEVESAAGAGARVTVALPLAPGGAR